MKILSKILSVGFATAVLFSSTSAFAGTIGTVSLSGTNSSTGYAHLGTGNHTLYAKGLTGQGTAYAKKINVLFPDSTVASATVTAPLDASQSFTAQAYTSAGDVQSYYINWRGTTSSASANVSIY